MDKGPWKAGSQWQDEMGSFRVFIESDDFNHDVRLYIDGNFADTKQKIKYAEFIAAQLNNKRPLEKNDAR